MIQLSKKTLYLVLCVIITSTLPCMILLKKETRKISKIEKTLLEKYHFYNQTIEALRCNFSSMLAAINRDIVILPQKLAKLPCSQERGIVTNVRTIDIKGIAAPYNSSIIEGMSNDYYLFFRHDLSEDVWTPIPFCSYIGFARLDKDFNVMSVIEKIKTKSDYSEDPKAVKINGSYYLTYNDLLPSKTYCRTIHVGRWQPFHSSLDYVTNLDQHIKPIEKNWVPFEYGSGKKSELHFVYSVSPHKILELQNPKKNLINHLVFEGNPGLQRLAWNEKWGTLRGGTPARLIKGEYLSFFHSSFVDQETVWYVMGAYTFEKHPPFRVTSISKHPILFKGIYESPHINTANPKVRCIFPAGFVIEESQDRTLLHVSCGENDSATKIVTINYDVLKKSMVRVKDQ